MLDPFFERQHDAFRMLSKPWQQRKERREEIDCTCSIDADENLRQSLSLGCWVSDLLSTAEQAMSHHALLIVQYVSR